MSHTLVWSLSEHKFLFLLSEAKTVFDSWINVKNLHTGDQFFDADSFISIDSIVCFVPFIFDLAVTHFIFSSSQFRQFLFLFGNYRKPISETNKTFPLRSNILRHKTLNVKSKQSNINWWLRQVQFVLFELFRFAVCFVYVAERTLFIRNSCNYSCFQPRHKFSNYFIRSVCSWNIFCLFFCPFYDVVPSFRSFYVIVPATATIAETETKRMFFVCLRSSAILGHFVVLFVCFFFDRLSFCMRRARRVPINDLLVLRCYANCLIVLRSQSISNSPKMIVSLFLMWTHGPVSHSLFARSISDACSGLRISQRRVYQRQCNDRLILQLKMTFSTCFVLCRSGGHVWCRQN